MQLQRRQAQSAGQVVAGRWAQSAGQVVAGRWPMGAQLHSRQNAVEAVGSVTRLHPAAAKTTPSPC